LREPARMASNKVRLVACRKRKAGRVCRFITPRADKIDPGGIPAFTGRIRA
jgi:hypothetical protein